MNRAVFLDRDGVIVEDSPYAYKPDQLRFIAGASEAIKLLNANKFLIIVVCNQSGVARGYYSEDDVRQYNKNMEDKLKSEGAVLDAIYYCPHHPDAKVKKYRINCDCRKPKPGMLLKAAAELSIEMKQSVMIGDRLDDIKAGRRAQCKLNLLVSTGRGTSQRLNGETKPDQVFSNLLECAKFILTLA